MDDGLVAVVFMPIALLFEEKEGVALHFTLDKIVVFRQMCSMQVHNRVQSEPIPDPFLSAAPHCSQQYATDDNYTCFHKARSV
jgi:hypothetical protein